MKAWSQLSTKTLPKNWLHFNDSSHESRVWKSNAETCLIQVKTSQTNKHLVFCISENREISHNYILTNLAGDKRSSITKRNYGKPGTRLVVGMCLGRQNATSLESSGEYQKTRSSAGSEKRIWRYWLLELQNSMLSLQHLFLVLITHWFHNRFLLWVMRFLPISISILPKNPRWKPLSFTSLS